jgi:hypothetical protein
MSFSNWLKLVENFAPIILAATPLAPIAPYVALGIQTAEQIKGATGEQKLALATQIANVGVAATNAQAGKVLIDPNAANSLITNGINAVVAATNLKTKS